MNFGQNEAMCDVKLKILVMANVFGFVQQVGLGMSFCKGFQFLSLISLQKSLSMSGETVRCSGAMG